MDEMMELELKDGEKVRVMSTRNMTEDQIKQYDEFLKLNRQNLDKFS